MHQHPLPCISELWACLRRRLKACVRFYVPRPHTPPHVWQDGERWAEFITVKVQQWKKQRGRTMGQAAQPAGWFMLHGNVLRGREISPLASFLAWHGMARTARFAWHGSRICRSCSAFCCIVLIYCRAEKSRTQKSEAEQSRAEQRQLQRIPFENS